MKRIFQNISLLLITFLILFLLCEGVCRIYYSSAAVKTGKLDDVLGWDVVHNLSLVETKKDFSKKPYQCVYSTDSNGFRRYGNVNSSKPKILFIGDSFTQAEDASDDSTYFSVVAQKVNVEVFAYGVGGFGNVQEMMVLQKYIAQIKPNMVVIQFTSNDFINNCYNLEFRSIQNNGRLRPYLNTSSIIEYRFARRFPEFRNFANNYSRFLYFIINRIDNYYKKPDNFQKSDYKESFGLTSLVFKQINNICRTNNATLTSFMVDGVDNVEANLYHDLMQKLNIEILAEVPTNIEKAEKLGSCCKAEDGGHWNYNGHRICGTLLAENIAQKFKK